MTTASSKLRHSRTSKVLVLISGIVLFLFLFVSFFLDKKVEFNINKKVQASPEQVLPILADLKSWQKWSVWDDTYYRNIKSFPVYETNAMGETVKSIESQVSDKKNQVIVIERKKKSLEKVVFKYTFWDGKENTGTPLLQAFTTFILTPVTEGTLITWQYQADYSPVIGINPLQKYFLLFTEYTLKRAYRESLANLNNQFL